MERSDDLFDVSQGGLVTNASPQSPLGGGSDARSAIGFSSSFVAPTHAIFVNGGFAGQIDFVEFQTPTPIQLTGFELWLRDDSIHSGNPWRGASSFRLLASTDGIAYSEVSQSSISNDYLSSYRDDDIVVSDTLPNINSQYFRLELTRFDSTGIRIVELDGFGVAIPESLPGDGNLDGWVDGLDYLLWASHFGDNPAEDPPGSPGNGDYDDNGVVDGLDYLVWAANFGTHAPSTTVPEPSTVGLILMGLTAMVWGCRRRK